MKRKHLCDALMLQSTQHLGLALESPDELGVAKSAPQHLDGDSTPRSILLRRVHNAHTARTDGMEHEEWPKRGPGRKRTIDGVHVQRRNRRRIEKSVFGCLKRLEKRFDFGAEPYVAAAPFGERRVALLGAHIGEGEKYLFGEKRYRVVHAAPPAGGMPGERSWRYNQARANAHSFLIVAGDKSSAFAVSSTLRPAKYLNATIFALRGSTFSSCVNA
jgi:hypothetical protein